MTRERYANLFETTLTADVSAGATTWPVASVTNMPAVNTRLVCGTEIVLVTAVSTLNLTVTRGAEGTTAASHTSGDRVIHVLTAAGLAASSGPMTTLGDMTRALADGEITRLPIGVESADFRVQSGIPAWQLQNRDVIIVLDGGGSAIPTGIAFDFALDWAGTFTQWTLLGNATGSAVIDIWKDTYANFPPTVADTITASAKPTISASNKGQSASLSGWTAAFAAGDIFRVNVDSCTTITKLTLILRYTRT